ncbi:DUF768 domain-containing protein [Mesorhizobium sp. ArgA1]
MSTRGTDFLQQWLIENVPTLAGSDIISVANATQELFRDAEKQGISAAEIAEDNGSIYEAVLDAIVHYHNSGLGD